MAKYSLSLFNITTVGSEITGYVSEVELASGMGPAGSVNVGPDARSFVFSGLQPQTAYRCVHLLFVLLTPSLSSQD